MTVGVSMGSESSIFEYMYRDGGNFKTFGRLRISGWDERADAKIRLCLESGELFVAEQIGVPSLCEKHWESVGEGPSDLDHAYHEFICLRRPDKEDEALTVWGGLDQLLARMEAAARRWDVRLSPNCDL